MDETDTPTTHAEHIFVASELRRLGVRWASLAPRFVGRFEKGVDYIGDLAAFDADMRVHAAIARAFGPYKISLHSGSDKFSIYEIAARHDPRAGAPEDRRHELPRGAAGHRHRRPRPVPVHLCLRAGPVLASELRRLGREFATFRREASLRPLPMNGDDTTVFALAGTCRPCPRRRLPN